MNRNKLDNALLRKVEQTRIDPPSDMWDRIASTLNEQGLTAGTASAAAKTARPARSKRLRWRYAAAAAAIICAVVIGYRMSGVDDLIIIAETVTVEPAVQSIPTPAETEIRMIAQAARNVEKEPDLNQDIAASAVEETPKETQSDAEEVAPISAAPDWRRAQTKSSDMRSEGGVPVYNTTEGAEAGRRDKRATPLAVSLYAGNFGTAKTVQNTSGGALRASSDNIYDAGTAIMYGTRQSALTPTPVSLKHKFPVSFGFTLSTGLTDRLAVESGVVYSYLYSESDTPTTGSQYKHEQKLHYLGIPIGVKYDLFRRPFYSVYASAGGLFEMCVSGQYIQTLYSGGVAGMSSTRRMNVYGIQSSVNMQVGAEFRMSKNFSLYLEPGVSYYFDNARQPENYRTENPINMSFKAGVRIRMN